MDIQGTNPLGQKSPSPDPSVCVARWMESRAPARRAREWLDHAEQELGAPIAVVAERRGEGSYRSRRERQTARCPGSAAFRQVAMGGWIAAAAAEAPLR